MGLSVMIGSIEWRNSRSSLLNSGAIIGRELIERHHQHSSHYLHLALQCSFLTVLSSSDNHLQSREWMEEEDSK